MDLYAENVLHHYHNPQHYGEITSPTIVFDDNNPFCGDTIHLTLLLNNGIIEDAKFTGGGCAISQATTSMLLGKIIGKTVTEVQGLSNEYIFDLLGVPLSPARVKCALLSFSAIKKALTKA